MKLVAINNRLEMLATFITFRFSFPSWEGAVYLKVNIRQH